MIITIIYDLEMAKTVHLQLHGVEKAVVVKADKIELNKHEGRYVVKLGTEQVGEFRENSVTGWWIQDD